MAIDYQSSDNSILENSNDCRRMLQTPEPVQYNEEEDANALNSLNSTEKSLPLTSVVEMIRTEEKLDVDEDITFDRDEWQVAVPALNRKRPPRQFEFLRKLLENTRYSSYITWIDEKQGSFRILQPELVATLWGKVKNRQTNGKMDYDTFARGIRYYYKKGIMIKTNKKHVLCFNRSSK